MNRAYFQVDADEVAPVIQALKEALAHRPVPEGTPYFDLESAIAGSEEFFESVRNMGGMEEHLTASQRHGFTPGQKRGFGSLAASFLLGWWFGRT